MLVSSEKQGGAAFNNSEAEILRGAMEVCNFVDLGYVGHDFTWTNNQGGDDNLQERLDRFFATPSWRAFFPGSIVLHLCKRKSDHLPLLLCIKGDMKIPKKKRRRKLYRFEEMWLRDESCAEIIIGAWERNGDIFSKFAHTSNQLSAWSRNKFGNFMKEMKACKNEMEMLMGETQTEEIIAQMKTLDDRLEELEHREEMY